MIHELEERLVIKTKGTHNTWIKVVCIACSYTIIVVKLEIIIMIWYEWMIMVIHMYMYTFTESTLQAVVKTAFHIL